MRKALLLRWPSPLLLAGLLLLLACGGSGGGPAAPQALIVFTPDQPAVANSLSLQSATVSDRSFSLELVANEVSDVSAVTFILAFPASLVRFDGANQGDFLGSFAFLTVSQLPVAGSVLVVDLSVAESSGSGVVLQLHFTAQRSGRGAIRPESPEAQDLNGTVLSDVTWSGGTIDIQL